MFTQAPQKQKSNLILHIEVFAAHGFLFGVNGFWGFLGVVFFAGLLVWLVGFFNAYVLKLSNRLDTLAS